MAVPAPQMAVLTAQGRCPRGGKYVKAESISPGRIRRQWTTQQYPKELANISPNIGVHWVGDGMGGKVAPSPGSWLRLRVRVQWSNNISGASLAIIPSEVSKPTIL